MLVTDVGDNFEMFMTDFRCGPHHVGDQLFTLLKSQHNFVTNIYSKNEKF